MSSACLQKHGNGVVTNYAYFSRSRRLENLQTTGTEGTLQNINYTYDLVGNILQTVNNGFITRNADVQKTVTQTYQYDDLYWLTRADGTYERDEDSHDRFTNTFSYDVIGSMLGKFQNHEIYHPADGSISPRPQTIYDLDYAYV